MADQDAWVWYGCQKKDAGLTWLPELGAGLPTLSDPGAGLLGLT